MTVDKLFDGSDAHLLPGNAELIEPPHEIICYALKVGDWFKERDITHWKIADCASRNALEAADKRIAELESGWVACHAQLAESCDERYKLERKLAVAREAIQQTIAENGHLADGDVCTLKSIKEALAQIGVDDEQT